MLQALSGGTPDLIAAIEAALQPDVAGDPISGVRWTRRTTGKLAAELATLGFQICPRTVARILKHLDYRLRVNHKRVSAANAVPVFTDGAATTRSVAENTAAGRNVGAAVAATDTDNDPLTYTLGGTDAASFDIVAANGQLLTKAALDHESKQSYTLTVTASDGNGGSASIAVTVAVTDMNEEPTGKPVISGTGYMYEPLAVDTSGITDADGLSTPSFTYQWRSGHAGETTGGAIPGATGDGFTPGTAEFGKWLQVVVSYTDNAANRESVSSEPTAVVRTRGTDYTQPLRVWIGTTAPQPVGAEFTVQISFFIGFNGEPVSGFTLEDISVTNGTASELRRWETFAYQATINAGDGRRAGDGAGGGRGGRLRRRREQDQRGLAGVHDADGGGRGPAGVEHVPQRERTAVTASGGRQSALSRRGTRGKTSRPIVPRLRYARNAEALMAQSVDVRERTHDPVQRTRQEACSLGDDGGG